MKRKKNVKGISRIDSKNTHGWYVRIYANGGVFTSKLFSDRQYGSKEKALKNAVAFRDHNQMVAELQKSDDQLLPRRPFYRKPPKNNSSGIVGVHKISTKVGEKETVYFQATWNEGGKMHSKKYYITKTRSAQEAFDLAVAWRKSKEEQLYTEWLAKREKYLKNKKK